jgi:O-antigen ligase
LAAYLNGSVFFLLSYVVLGKRVGLRVFFALAVVAMVMALVHSGSRGGWLSLMVGGAVWLGFLLIDLKRHGSRLFVPLALVGLPLVVAGGVTSVGVVRLLTAERQVEQNPDRDPEVNLAEADGGRMAFQQMAFEVFQDEPVLGGGPRAFSYRSLEKWDRDALGIWTNLPVYAHNEYLQVLSDYGLVGFLVVVALLFGHGIAGLAGVLTGGSRDREVTIWQIGAAGGLTAILTQSFFSFLFHYPACLALAAVQLGMLASPLSPSRRSGVIMGRVVALAGLAVAAGLIVAGWPLGQSYRLQRQGMKELSAAESRDQVFRAFETLTKAGNLAKEPDIFEVVARRAMAFANEAEKGGHPDLARELNVKAKEALERSLELNPHFGEGIAGLPRVNDKLGNFAEAEKGHERAMKELWTREISLRPHYQAARSSYFKSFRTESSSEALSFLYLTRERLQRRLEILRRTRDQKPMRDFGAEVEAWIAFHEGRELFQKGDDIWKNARPRNPGLAMTLLLEARKRYDQSKEVVAGKEPRWAAERKQLETHLGYLQAGRTDPVPLTEEELRKYLPPEVGLATDGGSR